MNEEIILKMINPYLKNDTLTYEEFENIFCILSLKEQYQVSEILYSKGIELVDKDIEEDVLDIDFAKNNKFEVLYDDSIFKDQSIMENDEEHLRLNHEVYQSNETLCMLIQQGNRQAVQDLCIKNRRLVDKYVVGYQKKYGNRLGFDDLEQVGFLGLIKAAHKFDIEQGAFSTYAVFWIKQRILREIIDNGFAIRIPAYMMERINKVLSLDIELDKEGLELQERISAIADELGISCENVRECLIIKNNYLSYASLNAPIGEEDASELGEILPEEGVVTVEEIVERNSLCEEVKKALSSLSNKEQNVLRLRYGIDDGRERTLEEVGKIYNVTRERIRQIEANAFKKIVCSGWAKRLKDFI